MVRSLLAVRELRHLESPTLPGNQRFQVHLNKWRNQQGNPDNLDLLSPSLFFCSIFIGHFWLLCSSGAKMDCFLLRQLSEPQLQAAFRFLKILIAFSSETQRPLQCGDECIQYLPLCLYLNSACTVYTHCHTSGNIFIDLFGRGDLFSIQKKILRKKLSLLTSNTKLLLLLTQERVCSLGGGDGRQR